MAKFFRIGFALLLVAGQPVSAQPQDMTGEELFAQCSDSAGTTGRDKCESYINGVVSGIITLTLTMQIIHPDSAVYPPLFCVGEASPSEIIEATRRYLKENPEGRTFNAASQVMLSLRQAFPCVGQQDNSGRAQG